MCLLKSIIGLVSKNPCSAHISESQKLLKSPEKYFYPTFSSFSGKWSQKKSFLVKSENLGVLVNTMTANYEYFCSNRENLLLPIQMQLSERSKLFCCFFIVFLEFRLNFERFEKKKNEPHRSSIS